MLSKTIFESSPNPRSKGKIPDAWIPKTKPEEESNLMRLFSMPLRNVGLGAAKSIKVTWSFPIDSVVSTVNEIAQKSLVPAYFEYENEMLSLKSEVMGTSVSAWRNQKNQNIDFVLPAPVDTAPIELALPHSYIQLVSALIHFAARSENFDHLEHLPSLNLDIDFIDIGGGQHKSKFSISTEIVSVTGKGGAFQGYAESRNRA